MKSNKSNSPELLNTSLSLLKLPIADARNSQPPSLYHLQVIAEKLSEEEIGGLKELFKMIDTDNSGTITFDELKEGLRRVGSELMESEIKDLMDAVREIFIKNFSSTSNVVSCIVNLIIFSRSLTGRILAGGF